MEWAGMTGSLPSHCLYSAADYHAERDKEPKKTLDELTRESDRFDRYYGEGNVELATGFAEDYWKEFAHLDDIRAQCKRGYHPFERAVTQRFRQVARMSRRRS